MCTWYWFISLYVPWSKDGFLFPSAGSLGDFFHDLNSWDIPELEVCRWEDHQSSSIFKRENKHITINYIINVPYLNFPYINHQSIPGAVSWENRTWDVGKPVIPTVTWDASQHDDWGEDHQVHGNLRCHPVPAVSFLVLESGYVTGSFIVLESGYVTGSFIVLESGLVTWWNWWNWWGQPLLRHGL